MCVSSVQSSLRAKATSLLWSETMATHGSNKIKWPTGNSDRRGGSLKAIFLLQSAPFTN